MRILIGSLAALLALSGAAQAHYPGGDTWHDFGDDLGFLEESPLGPMLPPGQATGLCWYSESEFPVDLFHGPPHTHLGDILGHYYGVGVGEGCGGMVGGPACDEGSENPGIFVLFGTTNTFPLVAFCHGADPESLPEPPSGPPELPEPLACIVNDPASALVCAGAPPVEVPPEVACIIESGVVACVVLPEPPVVTPPGVPPLPALLDCIVAATTPEGVQACLGPLPEPPVVTPPGVPPLPAPLDCIAAATTPEEAQACLGPLPEPPVVTPPGVPPLPAPLDCIAAATTPEEAQACLGPLPEPPVVTPPPAPPLPEPLAALCAALPPEVAAEAPACIPA